MAAEVKDQADVEAGYLQVVEELGVVPAGEQIEHFQLNDDLPKTDEVWIVYAGKTLPFVFDDDCFFNFEGNSAGLQLTSSVLCSRCKDLRQHTPRLIAASFCDPPPAAVATRTS